MKTFRLLLAIPFLMVLQSCTDDFANVTVTYTKGTPIYGDMDEVRNTALTGTAREITNPGKIFVAADYLLIGEEELGVHVVDNSDPANPVNSSFINIPGNREFFYQDGFLYAESYYDMLKLDLTNPANPLLVSRVVEGISEELIDENGQTLLGFEFETVTEKVGKNDNVYNALQASDYILYDYRNNLIPVSAVPASFAGNSISHIGSVNRIVYHEGYVYTVSRSNLMVFKDDNSLERVHREQLDWGGNLETVFPMEDNLFIGATNQMLVMDISDPENPVFASSFWHATSCDPVFPTTLGVAYVTLRTGEFAECPGDENALVVLDIEDVERPILLQEITMESPFGLTMIGTSLYVGEGESGLKVFDATNPKELTLLKWEHAIKAYDVLPNPSRSDFILVAGTAGLSQYRISDGYEHVSTLAY